MHNSKATSRTAIVAWSVMCVTTLLSGCTGSSTQPAAEPPTGAGTAEVTPGSTPTASAPVSADIGRARRPNERWADANGVEYLGKVPMDVFFDQPYSIVQDTTQVGVTGSPAMVASTDVGMSRSMSGGNPPPAAEADPPPAADGGGDGWAELMPIETLLEEINSSRNFMKTSLQTVGAYNSSMLMIPPKAAGVAVLATIAMEHPEEVSWKEDAGYIRDFAKQMNESTLRRGKPDQVRLLTLFENMSDTLNRSKPADLAEPPATDSYADVAEMRLLMMRMDSGEKRMKNEAGTETAFATKKETIRHEAAILGAMTKVTTMAGYGYEDDEEFIGYAQRIIDAAKSIQVATEVNDFAAYENALTKITLACTECHSTYR